MLKCFYRTTKKEKLFYTSKLSERSSAYGQEIIDEFNAWKQFVDSKNALINCKFRLLANGDIGNNCVIGQKDVRYVYARNLRDYALQDLWINGSAFTIDTNGYINYDYNRVLYPGVDVKAWGIICTPQENIVKYYLVVIASGKDECNLSVYSIKDAGKVTLEPIATTALSYSYAESSFIACIGCNIFVIHNERLGYYRFVPDKRRIEKVLIGSGEFNVENGALVSEPIIATDGGYVLWVSENSICGLHLGSPGYIYRFGTRIGFDITSIQSFHNNLYVYYKAHAGSKKMCYTYPVSGLKAQTGELFNENANFNLILDDDENQLRYVKITDKNVELKRRYKGRVNEVTERSFAIEKTSNKISLANGELYVGSLQAGFIK